jgi:hypothetical protein
MLIPNDWSWRSITLLQIGPAVLQIIFIYCKNRVPFPVWAFLLTHNPLTYSTGVPESPRWHIARGRHDEALATLAKYHANGDSNNATVQFEFHEIKETLALEMELKKTSSYLDFLRTRGNRYRLMLLISLGIISQYSGNALFSNYTNLVYNSMGITEQGQKIPVGFLHRRPFFPVGQKRSR